jgi:NAD(P)-dependent dehydrogenase (short-subunit alcohol dehydrogenase family)
MRNPQRSPQLAEIAARENLPIDILTMDVDSDESVKTCFAAIALPIDVLVNNAGIEVRGSIEEVPMESLIAVMNTNYFGTVRCIKAVVPQMRQRRSGCIINISSVSGRIANSPLGPYSASKFAVEAISEALAGEVKPFGIRVAIVEPGIQDTRMARDIINAPQSLYPQVVRFGNLFRAALANPTSPETTAAIIRGIVESDSWQLRYPSGPDAVPFMQWRASMSDQQWIDWNAQDDDAWYEALQKDFGLNARPTKAAGN